MNWVDTAVVAVVLLSAILAFTRGFVRELLGIGAWIGAVFFAYATVDMIRDRVRGWIGNQDIADPVAFSGMFLIGLIVLSVVTGMIGSAVRTSVLGGLDRTLGVVFGVARAVVLVAAAYIAAGWVVTTDRWPEPVQHARTLPYAYAVARWMVEFLPMDYRPAVPLPPLGEQTSAADLFRALPMGRATGRP